MKPLLVLMVSLLVLCGCAGQGHVPAPSRESALRPIIVDIVPSPYAQNADWSLCDNCLLIDGCLHTWAAFDLLLKQRAAAEPSSLGPWGTLKPCLIPLIIRTGRDTPVALLQFTMTVCWAENCYLMTSLQIDGEPQAYRMIRYPPIRKRPAPAAGATPSPETTPPPEESPSSFDDDEPSDVEVESTDEFVSPFFIQIFCSADGAGIVWRVNNTACRSNSEIVSTIRDIAARVEAGTTLTAYMDSDCRLPVGALYDAYSAAYEAGIRYFLFSPPRIALRQWPKALRRLLSPFLGSSNTQD